MSKNNTATSSLAKQLSQLKKTPPEAFSAGLVNDDNLLEWEITIIGPHDSAYEGGLFHATLTFPEEYPMQPPKMRFTTKMWHPNIYPETGEVCISILHPPGEDQYGFEGAGERWMPVHTVESITLSVISLLLAPNTDSPANVDASTEFRDKNKAYWGKVRKIAENTLTAWE